MMTSLGHCLAFTLLISSFMILVPSSAESVFIARHRPDSPVASSGDSSKRHSMGVVPDHSYQLPPVEDFNVRNSPQSDSGGRRKHRKKGVANRGFENIPDIMVRDAEEGDCDV